MSYNVSKSMLTQQNYLILFPIVQNVPFILSMYKKPLKCPCWLMSLQLISFVEWLYRTVPMHIYHCPNFLHSDSAVSCSPQSDQRYHGPAGLTSWPSAVRSQVSQRMRNTINQKQPVHAQYSESVTASSCTIQWISNSQRMHNTLNQ